LLAFWGAEAARRQGEEALQRFHRALLRRVYQDALALADSETLFVAAGDAGLDLTAFQETFDDPSCLERVAKDHTRAVGRGVFGTPTFVFPNAEPVYLKLTRVLTPEESLDFWETFRSTAIDRPYVLEIKRPH
jgi:2-hydroxychromene-2-carboxylate isomerase